MDAIATPEQEKVNPVTVRLRPVDQSDQPIMANCSTVSIAQGIAYLDFGFLARMIHDPSTAIADPLFRQAFGRGARPSDPRRTARVRLRSSGLRAPVSRRGWAISRRIVMNHAD